MGSIEMKQFVDIRTYRDGQSVERVAPGIELFFQYKEIFAWDLQSLQDVKG